MKTDGPELGNLTAEGRMESAVETHFWLEARHRRVRERLVVFLGILVGILAFLGSALTQFPDWLRLGLFVCSGLGFSVALVILSTRSWGKRYYNGPSWW